MEIGADHEMRADAAFAARQTGRKEKQLQPGYAQLRPVIAEARAGVGLECAERIDEAQRAGNAARLDARAPVRDGQRRQRGQAGQHVKALPVPEVVDFPGEIPRLPASEAQCQRETAVRIGELRARLGLRHPDLEGGIEAADARLLARVPRNGHEQRGDQHCGACFHRASCGRAVASHGR
jgi:hypothetical protein